MIYFFIILIANILLGFLTYYTYDYLIKKHIKQEQEKIEKRKIQFYNKINVTQYESWLHDFSHSKN